METPWCRVQVSQPSVLPRRRSLTEVLMIDQDYEELLGRAPPHGDVLEWTFPTSYLANAFASLLVGTPVLCLVLYSSGESSGDWDPHGGAELRVSPETD